MKTLAGSLVLVACILTGSGEANAAPRGPSARERESMNASRPTGAPEERQLGLASWLTSMKGRYSITLVLKGRFTCLTPTGEGTIQSSSCLKEEGTRGITYVSAAECRGVGEGPGLYCKFDMLRRAPEKNSEAAGAGQAGFLLNDPLPIMALFGIDPVAGKISVMTMNFASVVRSGLGSLQGDAATFDGRCDSALANSRSQCKWSIQIDPKSDGRSAVMKHTMNGSTYTFELDRVQQP